jgi:hypothetical protein
LYYLQKEDQTKQHECTECGKLNDLPVDATFRRDLTLATGLEIPNFGRAHDDILSKKASDHAIVQDDEKVQKIQQVIKRAENLRMSTLVNLYFLKLNENLFELFIKNDNDEQTISIGTHLLSQYWFVTKYDDTIILGNKSNSLFFPQK